MYARSGWLLRVRRTRHGWPLEQLLIRHPCRSEVELEEWWTVHSREYAMKKLGKAPTAASRFTLIDKVTSKFHPQLVAFMTDREFDESDGGGPRQPGIITIWTDEGSWRAKLLDKSSNHVCYVAGETWTDLLTAADAACGDPGAGWKLDPNQKPRRSK